MNPPQLYYASQAINDDVFVPANYKQQLSLWNEQHLAGSRYSTASGVLNTSYGSSGVNGCDEICEMPDDEELMGENDIVLIKVMTIQQLTNYWSTLNVDLGFHEVLTSEEEIGEWVQIFTWGQYEIIEEKKRREM